MSTEAGWTIASSHGSMTIRPSETRRRIVPSERTDAATRPKSVRAGGADARRRGWGRLVVRATAWGVRERRRRVRSRLAATASGLVVVVRLLVDCPPDHVTGRQDRQLER